MTTTDTRPVMAAAPRLTVVPDETPAVFDATAVVEQDNHGSITHEVQVTLTDVQWRMLVADIAARILYLRSHRRPILGTLMAAGVRPNGVGQQRALDELLAMLTGPTHLGSAHSLPPTFTLTPEDAGAFALALAEASDDPVECACGNVVHQPSGLSTTCGFCADRLGGDR